MTHDEIQAALAAINGISFRLEEEYTDNGGEVTDETVNLEEEKEALASLLQGEGIDSLGRWLKSKEDEKAMWKAERAAADAHMKSVDKTIGYIKELVGRILRETGTDKVKGAFYSFSQYTSTSTSVNQEMLDEQWLQVAENAVRDVVPPFVHIALKTTATELKHYMAQEYINEEQSETCRFTKPKGKKEE